MKKHIILFSLTILIAMISQAQNVGINSDGSTPDASAMLDVKSSTKGFLAPRMASLPATGSLPDGLIVYKNDGLEADMGYYYCKNNTWIKIGDATDATQWTTSGSNIYYNSGNVGIGTSSPSHLLTISGSLASNPQPVLSLDASEWFTFSHQSGYGSINWFAKANGTDLINTHSSVRPSQIGANDGELFFATAPTNGGGGAVSSLITRMVINPDGKVCIGTTTPQARLTIGGFGHGVLGGITMTPDNDTEGGHYMTFTNAAYTTAIGSIARGPGETVVYNTTSDYRLKENVVNLDIDQAKSRLMSLRPVEHNYISDPNKTVISGFLAHEMADAGFANGVTGEKDAVDKDGKPIYQAIDTKFLIPEMVKVIQEQQAEIEALKAQNANLKAENTSIKSDVEALKSAVFGTAQIK